MVDNEQSIESTEGAVTESSPSSAESTQSDTSNSTPNESAAPAQQKEDRATPFHEHPRFKELVEQKNKSQESVKGLESKVQELMKRLEEVSKPKQTEAAQEDALLKRLKGMDPEFGERIEKMWNKIQKIDEFDNRFQQMSAQELQVKAVTDFTKLLSDNKVPETLHSMYRRSVESLANETKAKIQDLPKIFKQVHDEYSALFENMKRSDRASYVQGKKADSSAPAAVSTGKTINPSKEPTFSRDPEIARAEMRAAVLKEIRDSKKL